MRLRCALFVLVVLPVSAAAQNRFPPDSLTNLRVLPRTMPVREVINMMRGFTGALGVRCSTCHVGEESRPLATYDFASDSLRMKRAAREMIRMVRTINRETLANLPGKPTPGVSVTCNTCHRGVRRPIPIEDIYTEALEVGGLDSAARAYRALRDRYYGSASYDFTDGPLNEVALGLARQRRYDDALATVALNGEVNARSSEVMVVTGEVYRMRGDTAQAVAAYRAALVRDPQAFGARRRLQEFGPQP